MNPTIFVDASSAHLPALLRLPENADGPAIAQALAHLTPLWNDAVQAVEIPRTAVNEVVTVLHFWFSEVELSRGVRGEAHPEYRSAVPRPKSGHYALPAEVIDYTAGSARLLRHEESPAEALVAAGQSSDFAEE
ncbi:hypothetical protein P3T36_004855 [Kitasatospora sp. MAP12-15]|uniref:hypothetical protein n=1 Tax=unclassified Kitasatospora TaxID=2633591 RepID=UPI002475F34C|nr:hypothetical protein [Kitasatospora sp. MAP12-44]MDH6110213.1 hypothetical protein [Kitasatospora sp. MAP12-44]